MYILKHKYLRTEATSSETIPLSVTRALGVTVLKREINIGLLLSMICDGPDDWIKK